MHIEIKDNTVEVKRGTGKSGRDYEISEQTGYMVTQDERRRIVIALRKGQTPFAPGAYVLADDSFSVDDYGQLKIGRLTIIPAAQRKVA